MSETVLIVGASGIIGRYCANHLKAEGSWDVAGLARKRPGDMDSIDFVEIDLLAPAPSPAAADRLAEVSHVVYAGYAQKPGLDWAALTALNADMFRGLLDLLAGHAPALRRIVLMQGQKYYGSHLGPFKTPSRENDPRPEIANFYYDQQDLLAERAACAEWDWACLRPHIVCGVASRSPMNLILQIGVYASLCKELGRPLRFPGTASSYERLIQATDAGLLARAVAWALRAPDCAGQAYNITNGDQFRWSQIFPIVAEVFALELAPPEPLSLQDFMAEQAPLWQELIQRHDLASEDLASLVEPAFGDYVFGVDWDVVANTVKARLHGFPDCRDSEEMFRSLMLQLRDDKQVP